MYKPQTLGYIINNGKILNFLGKDYNVTIKKSVSMKEYANRIFLYGKKMDVGLKNFILKNGPFQSFCT